MHHLFGDGAVGDADDGLGTGFDVGLIGQLQHIGLAEGIGVPNDRIGLGGFDFLDEPLAVGQARVLGISASSIPLPGAYGWTTTGSPPAA